MNKIWCRESDKVESTIKVKFNVSVSAYSGGQFMVPFKEKNTTLESSDLIAF